MPATIQVILQSDVSNVGKSGELVRVRPGYARNFLLPRKFALPATEAQVNRVNHEKAVAIAHAAKTKKGFEELAKKISATPLKIARPVGEDDRLFGSVTAKDIENAAIAAGLTGFDRKKLSLPDGAIKTLGTFELPVKLQSEVTATLKVEVVKK